MLNFLRRGMVGIKIAYHNNTRELVWLPLPLPNRNAQESNSARSSTPQIYLEVPKSRFNYHLDCCEYSSTTPPIILRPNSSIYRRSSLRLFFDALIALIPFFAKKPTLSSFIKLLPCLILQLFFLFGDEPSHNKRKSFTTIKKRYIPRTTTKN